MSRVYWRRAGKVTGKTLRGAERVEPTPTYWNTKLSEPVVDKQRPGAGFRHVLRRSDCLLYTSPSPRDS